MAIESLDMKKLKQAAIALLPAFSMSVWANPYQPNSQQWHNYNTQMMHEAQKQQNNYKPDRTREKIWEARERRMQRKIERYRKTLYYGVIAYNYSKNMISIIKGYASEKKAIQEATEGWDAADKTEIIATFSNACAVVGVTDKPPKSREDFFVGIDPDGEKADQKASNACMAKHGNHCFYMDLSAGKGNKMLCSGYDYGFYQK